MPNEQSSAPSSDPRPSAPARPPSAAWQPITPRGVAAFSQARIGRLLIVQILVAALIAGTVVWFLSTAWFPIVIQAIGQLPETGVIVNRQLITPRSSTAPLADNRFIAFFASTNSMADIHGSDVRIGFHRNDFTICSLFGCLTLGYPAGARVAFGRMELEAWWGAWKPMIIGFAALGTVAALFVNWFLLATFYWPFAWGFAYFKDRQLTLAGSWKLSSAALLPGALLCALGITLYGLGVLDLIRFLLFWVLHLVIGWAYLLTSLLALPRVCAVSPSADPFSSTKSKSGPPRPPNPFVSPAKEPLRDDQKKREV